MFLSLSVLNQNNLKYYKFPAIFFICGISGNNSTNNNKQFSSLFYKLLNYHVKHKHSLTKKCLNIDNY